MVIDVDATPSSSNLVKRIDNEIGEYACYDLTTTSYAQFAIKSLEMSVDGMRRNIQVIRNR